MTLPHISDEAIIKALENGKPQAGRFGNIAVELGVGCGEAALRRRLYKLERDGRIVRDARYSYPNSIYWRTAGEAA